MNKILCKKEQIVDDPLFQIAQVTLYHYSIHDSEWMLSAVAATAADDVQARDRWRQPCVDLTFFWHTKLHWLSVCTHTVDHVFSVALWRPGSSTSWCFQREDSNRRQYKWLLLKVFVLRMALHGWIQLWMLWFFCFEICPNLESHNSRLRHSPTAIERIDLVRTALQTTEFNDRTWQRLDRTDLLQVGGTNLYWKC